MTEATFQQLAANTDRTYFRCIRDYRWKYDNGICGAGRCGDLYLPLKRIDDDWHRALELETRRPTVVPVAFIEKFSANASDLRKRSIQRRATVDSCSSSASLRAGDVSANCFELSPPDFSELKSFLTRPPVDKTSRVASHSEDYQVHPRSHTITSSGGHFNKLESIVDDDQNNKESNDTQQPVVRRSTIPAFTTQKSLDSASPKPPRRPAPPPPATSTVTSFRRSLSKVQLSANDNSADRTRLREFLRIFFSKRASPDALKQRGILKDEPVFGACNIQQICDREQSLLPNFVEFSLRAIELRNGWLEEGLYRLSGSVSSIQKLRIAVNNFAISLTSTTSPKTTTKSTLSLSSRFSKSASKSKMDLSLVGFELYVAIAEECKCGIHELSGSLKLFFRELQQPLFTADESVLTNLFKLSDTLSINVEHQASKSLGLQTLKQILRDSYAQRLATLSRLFLHLEVVARHESVNKMNAYNLALVFAPSLFPHSLAFKPSATVITAALIQNAAFVFDR